MGLHRRRQHTKPERTRQPVLLASMESSAAERSGGDAAAERLRALVADYPGAAVHLHGNAIWFNSFVEELIGYEASDLATLDDWFATVFVDLEQQAREVYETSRGNRFPKPEVLTITRKDGAQRVVEFSGYMGKGEEVWFLRDLTETRRAVQALRDREERLQVTVDVAKLGTWEWDVDTGRMTGDDTARRFFGLSDEPDEATFDAYIGRVHSDDRPRLEDAIGTAIETRLPFDVELRVRRDEGRGRWLHVHGIVGQEVDSQGLRVIGAIQDIDDHKRLDERLIHSARMESLGRLAGGIAHDFNNLLVVIQGHLEFVANEPELSADTAKRIQSIASAVTKGAEMVSSLMQLGRSTSEIAGTVDINTWLGSRSDTLQQVVGKNVAVEYELEATAPFVRFDEARLASVVLNLATNARDAMPRGGVLRIATRNSPANNEAGSDAERQTVEVVFADTGVGMDPATRDRIFEPFFTTKGPGVGTGLGLASAYEAVLDAGGEISVASVLGEGAVFTTYLPSVQPDRTDPEPKPVQLERPVHDELIMVAEDDAEVLELAADILRSAGYRVLEALGPHEALEYVAVGEQPDLLLSDVVMPDLSGPELAARLGDQLPALSVLYMSGYASEASTDLDDDDLIRKPFSHHHLLDRVAKRLSGNET